MNRIDVSTYHHLVQTDVTYVDGKMRLESTAALVEGMAYRSKVLLDNKSTDFLDRQVTLFYPRYRQKNSEGYASFIYEVFAAIFDLLFGSEKQGNQRLMASPANRGYTFAYPVKTVTNPVNADPLPSAVSASTTLQQSGQLPQGVSSPRQRVSSLNNAPLDPNPILTSGTQTALLQPKESTAPTNQPRNPLLKPLIPQQQPGEDVSMPAKGLPLNPLPKKFPSLPSQPQEQLPPLPQKVHSLPDSPDAQVEPRVKSEPIPLVLDSSLTAEQIERITAYTLTPVPEFTEEELNTLGPQDKMKRELAIKNEPNKLKHNMNDIPVLLNDIKELRAEIAAELEASKDQQAGVEHMRKLQKLNQTAKERRLAILRMIFSKEEEKETLAQIPENECIALAEKYLNCAQERLEALASPVARAAVAKPQAIQDPIVSLLDAAKRTLKNTESALKTANSSVIRLNREIPALEKQMAVVSNNMQKAKGNNDLDALDPLLEKYSEMELAFEDKKKNREVNQKKAQDLPTQIGELKSKIEGLEQQLAERAAVQPSSMQEAINS